MAFGGRGPSLLVDRQGELSLVRSVRGPATPWKSSRHWLLKAMKGNWLWISLTLSGGFNCLHLFIFESSGLRPVASMVKPSQSTSDKPNLHLRKFNFKL